MARPLRIEYPGAWYHLMNRGANRKFIFYSDEHRKLFLSLLDEIVKLYSIEIHSYCLMGNHYHLLVRTPFPNLSKAMRHLNGIYTQKFNPLEKRDGALFRGRYKAILIQDDLYLLHVSRYIHLNPVVAKLCQSPDEYTWSSYQAYINKTSHSFIKVSTILNEIGGIEHYIHFIREGVDTELHKFYNKSIIPSVLGDTHFKKKALKKAKLNHIQSSPADVKRITSIPQIITIIEAVAAFYGTHVESLLNHSDRQKNVSRVTAICLSKQIGQYSYAMIAKHFNATPDAIRSVIRRYHKKISTDKNVRDIMAIFGQ